MSEGFSNPLLRGKYKAKFPLYRFFVNSTVLKIESNCGLFELYTLYTECTVTIEDRGGVYLAKHADMDIAYFFTDDGWNKSQINK